MIAITTNSSISVNPTRLSEDMTNTSWDEEQ